VDGDSDLDVVIGKLDGFGGNKLYFNETTTPAKSTSWGRVKALFDRR
jgi:hypothetical protein